ncbi:MAG: serine acetyltransferase [Phycisphaeraceae bacterium]|nr:MAG: serine acetyltransferase [Phycisphaeraceae bacterium]
MSSSDRSGQEGVSGDLVSRVASSILNEPRTERLGEAALPDRHRIEEMVELVRHLVFPGFFGPRGVAKDELPAHVETLLSRIRAHAYEQIRSVLRYVEDIGPDQADNPLCARCDAESRRIADAFLERLPELRDALALDVQSAYDGDPAAAHTDETIICYPGVDAVFAYRTAHILHELGAPLLPRIICEQAHMRTGIDIHPAAKIGRSFFIDHGAGVVIGQTAIIGDNVKLYQGVTLGAKSFPKDERGRVIRGQKRHPTIGDRVTIYAGAVILGGDTIIGDDCVITGGVFITDSIPPKHIVRQKKPELVMRTNREASGA